MNKQNLLVLGIIVLLIVAVAVAAMVIPQQRTLSGDAPTLSTEAPIPFVTATAVPVTATDAPVIVDVPVTTDAPELSTEALAPIVTATPVPTATEMPAANAYLLVSVQGMMYEPIPLFEEGSYTVKQGEDVANVIHVTPDSVYMESSTCDNQDCVMQGTVTLDNMSTRVLSNMVICLPNQVVLELHTPETLSSVLALQP